LSYSNRVDAAGWVRLALRAVIALGLVSTSCALTGRGSIVSSGSTDGGPEPRVDATGSAGMTAEAGSPDQSATIAPDSTAVGPPDVRIRPDVGTGPDAAIVDPLGDGDMTIGPGYKPAPESSENPSVPKGTVFSFAMSSSGSKIFPGVNASSGNPQPFTRAVWVYVPKQYVDGTAAPLLVVQDGGQWKDDLVRVLDNLIAARTVPTAIALLVDAGPADLGNQRGIEYDTISTDYVDFIEQEVLPAASQQSAIHAAYPNLKITANPEGRASMGCSSGGIAAFTMGWLRPDLYRKILSYSGSFTNRIANAGYPHGGWEYPEHLVADTAIKPLRVYLEVGERDISWDSADLSHNWPVANKTLAAALKGRGYHYQLVIAKESGHCDLAVRAQTLPDALRWLWRGYPID
jgi:enterochelin esterase family protein